MEDLTPTECPKSRKLSAALPPRRTIAVALRISSSTCGLHIDTMYQDRSETCHVRVRADPSAGTAAPRRSLLPSASRFISSVQRLSAVTSLRGVFSLTQASNHVCHRTDLQVDLAEIDATMAAHVAFLNKYHASGNFLVSGRRYRETAASS